MVSALLFPGAAIGALLGGKLADALGRKGSLLVCAGLFLVGALGCASAPNFEVMLVARVILGLGVGAAAATCPLFLAEMAPARPPRPDGHHQRVDDRHRADAGVHHERRAGRVDQGPARVALDARHRGGPGRRPADRHVVPARFPPLVRGEGPTRRHQARAGPEPRRGRGQPRSSTSSPSTPSGTWARTRAPRCAT